MASDDGPVRVRPVEGGVRFDVQVQPRASRSAVVGVHGDALKVRLQAPPVDGAANEALLDLLATTLGLKRRNFRLIAGLTSRRKTVEVLGASATMIQVLAARWRTAEL